MSEIYYSAYLGLYNEEAGGFVRHKFLGDFATLEFAQAAYERERSADSPHVIVARMGETIELDHDCETCGRSGFVEAQIFTE